ncbi:MAG: choice-of-anchor D domain-containing protein, partial [Candidatus Krumholzibacteria bacterium]|nr:choice-of-anchor D domain-containing protein [Candidatus Krumholzibacteria bacterium]
LDVKAMIMASVDVIPALMGRTVSGGRLNIYNFLSQLDSIPPTKVSDLTMVATSSNTATLMWTASGDDGTDGTASRYDIRYSESQIYWSNWDLATPVPNPPTPQPSGSQEEFEVWGLEFSTKYFFAIKVYDEQENESFISNLDAMGITLGIPQLSYDPTSFSESLATGGMSTQLLTIANDGMGTLDFSFSNLPGWLSTNPESGRVNAGENTTVEMKFDATGLPGGTHTAAPNLLTNDPAMLSVPINTVLLVTAAPDIAVAPESLDFGPQFTGTTVTEDVMVTNIGVTPLNVSGLSVDNPEFVVDPSGFVLAPSASRVVTVEFNPITIGPISGSLSISSDDPDTPVYTVPLAGEGVDPPVIVVTPTSLSKDLFTGGTA